MRLLARTLALLVLTTAARAATFTWDGGSTFNLWLFGDNWVGNVAPSPAQTGDDIIFAGSTRLSPFLDNNRTIASLAFAADAGGFDLTSDNKTLTIGAGGLTQGSATVQTISHALALGAAQTWSTAAGALTVGGNVSLGAHALTLSGAGGTTLGGVVSGTGGLTIAAGTHTLGGTSANTFTGTTTVEAGTLVLGKTAGVNAIGGNLAIGSGATARLAAANQLAGTATVTVASGATFDLNGKNETIAALVLDPGTASFTTGAATLTTNRITMTGGSISGNIKLGTVNTDGIIANGSATTGTITGSLDHGGGFRTYTVNTAQLDVSGADINGSVIKQGPGTLRIVDSPTSLGELTLGFGVVALASDYAGTVTFAGGRISAEGAPRTVSASVAFADFDSRFAIDGSQNITFTSDVSFFVPFLSRDLTVFGTGVVVLSGAVDGTMEKNGFGTVELSNGSNEINVSLQAGTLRLTNTSGFGAKTVNVGRRLEGTGSFSGRATFDLNAGVVAPGIGTGIGRLTGGRLQFGMDTGTLEIGLAGETAGTLYDQFAVRFTSAEGDGTVVLGGGSRLSLSLLGGFDPADGAVFYIVDNDGTDAITGTFSNVTGAPNPLAPGLATFFASGQEFAVSYAANWTGDPGTSAISGGNDIALIAVPEPGAAATLALGLAALLARRRRATARAA